MHVGLLCHEEAAHAGSGSSEPEGEIQA